jgi:hypothetical protein
MPTVFSLPSRADRGRLNSGIPTLIRRIARAKDLYAQRKKAQTNAEELK